LLNSADEKLVKKLMVLTEQKGDVIYDTVGGPAHQSVINAIAYKGRSILVGFAGGGWPKIGPLHVMLKVCRNGCTQ
jgi:NADPH2:quinone reductase